MSLSLPNTDKNINTNSNSNLNSNTNSYTVYSVYICNDL